MSDNVHDVIIIGGGIAGLFCALKLAPLPVTVLSAAPIGQGASSAWAQGGIAAAVAEGDSPEAHAREAAHSARRIVHVRGDKAGAAIMAALVAAVRNTPSIRVIEGVAEELVTE